MQAVAVRALRSTPEVMELPRPEPGPKEVVVRIGAAGLNPFDWKIIDGGLDGRGPHLFPFIVGVDGAGVVDGVGAQVHEFVEGDAVFGSFLHPPYGRGTFAQWAPAEADGAIARIPPGLEPATAAALPTAGMTALTALDQLRIAPGNTIMVVGAAGGVGSFAVQLAIARGAVVFAATRRDQFDYVRSLGAQETIDIKAGSVGALVRAAHPSGLDGLLDMASDPVTFQELMTAVRSEGAAASTIGSAGTTSERHSGVRRINIDMQPERRMLERLAEEVVTGRLRAPIESMIPLKEAPAALARSRTGAARGKTVVVP
ncbi:MAG TPA: NADP-dependent oxidoreductase [Thermoplasmata archaeon]|nr:NADP-dependent oxidoreductase [Thermoplasmata archaeon]